MSEPTEPTEKVTPAPAPAWVVAGAPGAGKTTVAALLLAALAPVPALLDKDTLFAGFVAEVQSAHGRPPGEREGPWYDTHVKVHEYGGMLAAARQIRATGCPVMLVAPFTSGIREPGRWQEFAESLGGGPVHLVWVSCDAPTLRARIEARGFGGDAGKLADWEAFVSRMQPDTPPPVPHLAIHNGAGARPPSDQVAAIVASVTPSPT